MTRTRKLVVALAALGCLTPMASAALPGPAPPPPPADVARALLEGLPREPADPLAAGIRLAAEATRARAALDGLALPAEAPPLPEGSPSSLALALVARAGPAPGPGARAALEALDHLPEPLRGALARTVAAFLALDQATASAYAAAQPLQPREGDRLGDAWARAGLDLGPALMAREQLLAEVLRLRDAARATGPVPLQVLVAPALALDLEGVDSLHEAGVLLSLDLGGHDTYRNQAGGAGPGRASAAVDLGGGNDAYGHPFQVGGNGASLGGVGMLVDEAGDDAYLGHGLANGAASLGAGRLLDTAGDDAYVAGFAGANGGALAGGLGQLLDLAGNDLYHGNVAGVNGGAYGWAASAMLLDGAGDDRYLAGFAGVNGGGLNGRGMLLDRAGDDLYQAVATCVNGGCIGLLYDNGGRDRYVDVDHEAWDETVLLKEGLGLQVDRAG